MTASRSSYARPVIVRGEQCAEAPLGRRRSDPAAAWQCSRQSHALAVASDPSLHGPRALQAPSTGIQLSVDRRPSARSLGVMAQDGPDAGHAVVTLSRPRPAFGVQCSVRASSVDTCLSAPPVCPVSGAGVRASRCPTSGVRCPVSVSAGADRGEVVERGGGAGGRTAGMAPGSAWSPAVWTTGSSSA